MDKQELKELIEEIKWAYEREDYDRVLLYAQEIDLRKVTDNRALEVIADAHAAKNEIQEARDILILAYERTPMGRKIAYKLSELSIALDDLDSAVVYFEDFCKMAPHDNDRYLLKYKIGKAGGVSPKDLVKVLAAYCSREVDEKWMYELASLYYKTRDREKCLEVCDNIILWFANGKYVENAIALKRRLNPETALEDARRENEGLNIIGGDIPFEGFIDTSAFDEFTEADFEENFLFGDSEDFKVDMLDEALTETGRSLEDIEIGEAMDIATAKENASVILEPEGKYAMAEEAFAMQEAEEILEDQIEVDGEVYTLPKTTFDDMSHDWTIPAELLKSDEPAKPVEYEEPVFGSHRYVAKDEPTDPNEPVYGAHRVVTLAEREEAARLEREEAERRAAAEAELERAVSDMKLEEEEEPKEPPIINVPVEEPAIIKPISEMSKATNHVEPAAENPAFATVATPGVKIPEEPVAEQKKEEIPEAPVITETVVAEPVRVEPVRVEPVRVEPVRVEPVRVEPVSTEPAAAASAVVEPVAFEPAVFKPAAFEPVQEAPAFTEPVRTEPIKQEIPISENPFISVVKEPTFQEEKPELAARNVNSLFDAAKNDNTAFVEEVKPEKASEEPKPFILSMPPKENTFQDENAFSENIEVEKVEEVIPPVIPVPETINIQPKTNKYESVKSLFRHDLNDNIDGQITLDSMFATYTKPETKVPEVVEEETEEKSFVPGFTPVTRRQVQVMPTVPKSIFDNEIRPEEKLYAEQEESYSTKPEIVENTPVEMEEVEDKPFVFVAPIAEPSRDEVKEIQTHYAEVMEKEKEKAKTKEEEGLKITNIGDYFFEFSGDKKSEGKPEYYDNEVFEDYDEPEVKAEPEYDAKEDIDEVYEEEYEEETPSIIPAIIPAVVAAEPEEELSDFEKAMMAFDAAKAEGKENFDFKSIFEEPEQKEFNDEEFSEEDLGDDFDDFYEDSEEDSDDDFQDEYSDDEYEDEDSDEAGEDEYEYEDEYEDEDEAYEESESEYGYESEDEYDEEDGFENKFYSEDEYNNEGKEDSEYDEYEDEYEDEYDGEYDDEYDDEYEDEYEDEYDDEYGEPGRYVLPDDIREEVYEFLLIDGMEERITSAIESIIDKKRSGDATGGNLVVTGDPKSGKTYLTIAIIKAVAKEVGGNSRVAKVKAEALNGKNMSKVFDKIEGSDLLIENIGYLNEATVEDLISVMKSGNITSLVAIEGNQLAIESVLNKHPELAKLFKTQVDIQELNLAQWADLACEYAADLGYTIDDMALLALHAKIDELNIPTARLGYEDIKSIIDKAIENANYKGKHKRGGKKNRGHEKELDESDFEAI